MRATISMAVSMATTAAFATAAAGGELAANVARRAVEGQGFHRWLVTDVELAGAASGTCVLGLLEGLGREVYVDFDEVKELGRLGERDVPDVLGVGFEGGIDVERPAEASEPHLVAVVVRDVALEEGRAATVRIRVPVHLRYQAPRKGAEFSEARFAAPVAVALACPRPTSLAEAEAKGGSDHADLLGRTLAGALGTGFLVRSVRLEPGTAALEVQVPVGRVEDDALVTTATAIVTLAGAAWLSWLLISLRESPESEHIE